MNSPEKSAIFANIRQVSSFHELANTPFGAGVNALCWARMLPGDFGEILSALAPGPGITSVELGQLAGLPLSPAGKRAAAVLLEDQERLAGLGLEPGLDCIYGYLQEEEPGPVRTDVCSFHVDRATGPADTWLCTYAGLPSEGLSPDQALRRVDDPATRAACLAEYGGTEDAGFLEYLAECCYDLHYLPGDGATPFSFGVGNLWRIAVDYPGSPVPPCIHRAPDPVAGRPRLLLIC